MHSLKQGFIKSDKVIWMHVASLGEYEQGLPLLEQLKKEYPRHKFLLTFFSPSGYDVKKDSAPVDVVSYLPLDTFHNAKRFLNAMPIELAIFIKYEIWPNYLYQLKKRAVPTILVSGIFSKRQAYFKWYGGLMRKALGAFTHFFVQENTSKRLLETLGHSNVSIGGDTRFDRVLEILKRDNTLKFMEAFKQDRTCFVAGSTWPEDEKLLVPFINAQKDLKVVIAPHDIKNDHIERLQKSIVKKTIRYSELKNKDVGDHQVLVIDTIGLLTKIYSYADIAYVGGGFATGLHNTLEPAVFGIPVIIGPQYDDFNEAKAMVKQKGILVVNDLKGLKSEMNALMNDKSHARRTGSLNREYTQNQSGATARVMDFVEKLI